MPVNRNALIRFKTIDACLRNRNRKWTLEMLIEKVSDALYEYEGIDKGISRRTLQADIQLMRSDKLGYNAPIIVVDKKYYTYEDPSYSITQLPISEQDLERMNEAVEVLRQFKDFGHFERLNDVVQKLEDHVYASTHKQKPIISFEKNEQLKGLHFLEKAYQAIIHKQVLEVSYQSFKATRPNTFPFHAWWLKEYRNRWFLVGKKGKDAEIMHLALDRIQELKIDESQKYYSNYEIDPDDYYKDIIGVTLSNTPVVEVILRLSKHHAPYILTKPLHSSQTVQSEEEKHLLISIRVQHNYELEKEILSYGEEIEVIAPTSLRERITLRTQRNAKKYHTL